MTVVLKLLDTPERAHQLESCYKTLSEVPHSILESVQSERLKRLTELEDECKQVNYTLISTERRVFLSLSAARCLQHCEPKTSIARHRLLCDFLVRWKCSYFVPRQELNPLEVPCRDDLHLIQNYEEILQ